MKYLIALTLLILTTTSLSAQGLEAENCNWKDVELRPYSDGLLENEVVVGSGTFLYDHKINSFEDLTEKQLKKIKKYAPMFKSCKVYVDFKQTIGGEESSPQLADNNLNFICVLKKE